MNDFLGETNTENHECISVISKDRLSQYINTTVYFMLYQFTALRVLESHPALHWFTRKYKRSGLKLSNIPHPPRAGAGKGEMYGVIQPGPDSGSSPTQSEAASSDICRGRDERDMQDPTILRDSVWTPAHLLGWPPHVIIIRRFQLLVSHR